MSTMLEARGRVLSAMAGGARPSASGIGYIGFPETKFRCPQAAARCAGRLIHALATDGLIRLHCFEDGGYEYRITTTGLHVAGERDAAQSRSATPLAEPLQHATVSNATDAVDRESHLLIRQSEQSSKLKEIARSRP